MASLSLSEHRLTSWDGTRLTYRLWTPPDARRAILLFHRGHEHSGRVADLVEGLAPAGTAVVAWDARGHGQSDGVRGDAPGFATLVRDAEAFARHVEAAHGIPLDRMAVAGLSVGAVVAAAWVHDYAPPVRALVLASPAFRVRLWVPLAIPLLRAAARAGRPAFVRSYVQPGMLTRDPAAARRYREDPLVTRAIAVRVLLGLHDAGRRLVADAEAITVPSLVQLAGADWVVDTEVGRRFFGRLGAADKELRSYPGFRHDLYHDTGGAIPLADARGFLERALDPAPAHPAPALLRPDDDALTRPLPPWSPRRWYFGGLRLLLRTAGRLSAGVRAGRRHGFDSGPSLDYVYEDTARGTTPLGRWLDRIYLDSPGWRAIRQRRVNLTALLRAAIDRVRAEGRPVRVVDVAAGPGRYVLDVLRQLDDPGATALLLDRDAAAVEAGRRLAAALGVRGAVHAQGDAFDAAALAALRPAPTVAVVSGLYELFPDNAPVAASLGGLRAALAGGGYLVYTCQPWHPQLELIARVLTNREGRPWVMRCRPQAEMDALVRQAGFEKLAMAAGEHGICTVSLARAA
jgi:alpha-beta hydrolase superfamily lysophospholipase